jgi:hypothetical protein
MRIAYCLTGFARVIHDRNTISKTLLEALPPNCQLDLFWYCPKQLDPDRFNEYVDQTALVDSFRLDLFRSVNIAFFDYTPSIFHNDIARFPFTVNDILNNRSVFRTLSQVYNITKSVQLAYESGNRYDVVIITRNDYIPYVKFFGLPSQLNTGIYAYRTCPYRTTSQQVNLGGNFLDTEDRVFYGTHDEMMLFRSFYDQLVNVFTMPKLYPEVLHTEFMRSVLPESRIFYQEGINIVFPPKRTDSCLHNLSDAELNVIRRRYDSH